MGGFVKRKTGRRGVQLKVVVAPVSDDQKAALFDELSKQFNFDIAAACKAVGISRLAYDDAIKADPEFAGKVLSYRGNLLKQIEDRMWSLALSGDASMIRMVLQAEVPEKYGSRKNTDVKGIESPEDLAALTDDQLEELMRG